MLHEKEVNLDVNTALHNSILLQVEANIQSNNPMVSICYCYGTFTKMLQCIIVRFKIDEVPWGVIVRGRERAARRLKLGAACPCLAIGLGAGTDCLRLPEEPVADASAAVMSRYRQDRHVDAAARSNSRRKVRGPPGDGRSMRRY